VADRTRAHARTLGSRCGSSRVLTGTAKSRRAAGARPCWLPRVHPARQTRMFSYLACAQILASASDVIFPQFATHNAHTVAYIIELFRKRRGEFEFPAPCTAWARSCTRRSLQAPRAAIRAASMHRSGRMRICCRTSVRRLLENGANTSFVNRVVDERLPASARRRRSHRRGRPAGAGCASTHRSTATSCSAPSAPIPSASISPMQRSLRIKRAPAEAARRHALAGDRRSLTAEPAVGERLQACQSGG